MLSRISDSAQERTLRSRKCPNGMPFISHLGELNQLLKHLQVVHFICDNASFHTRQAVREWVALHPGIRLVILPKYLPELNPSNASGGTSGTTSPTTTTNTPRSRD